jgi:hypothetical protein
MKKISLAIFLCCLVAFGIYSCKDTSVVPNQNHQQTKKPDGKVKYLSINKRNNGRIADDAVDITYNKDQLHALEVPGSLQSTTTETIVDIVKALKIIDGDTIRYVLYIEFGSDWKLKYFAVSNEDYEFFSFNGIDIESWTDQDVDSYLSSIPSEPEDPLYNIFTDFTKCRRTCLMHLIACIQHCNGSVFCQDDCQKDMMVA